MSTFTFNRTGNQIVTKNVAITNTIDPNSLKASIGSTGTSTIANFNTLSLNGTPISVTANQLNTTKLNTPGVAEPSKVLVTNNSNNITNLNSISCNTLIANGQNITSSTFELSSSNDINNNYLTNITDGNSDSNKALIPNQENSINNINSLSTKRLDIKNILINNSSINEIQLQNYENLYPNINTLNNSYIGNNIGTHGILYNVGGGVFRNNLADYYWSSICWSPELSIFVAVTNGTSSTANTSYRVMTSKNGFNWIFQIAIDNNWEDIIWISKLRLFVAVSNNGTNNQVMTSIDGINWISRTTPTINFAFKSITWTDELNLCVAVNTSNNGILISNDCINWSLVYTNMPVGLNAVCWSPELSLFVATASATYNSAFRIFVSNDGTNWNSIYNFTNSFYNTICWCPYYKIFLIPNTLSPNLLYSYDGYTWKIGVINYQIKSLIWVDELKLFYGYDDLGNVLFSKSGLFNWSVFQLDSSLQSQVGKMIWSPELGILITAMRRGWSGSASGDRFAIISLPYIGNKPLLLTTENLLYQDKINKFYGINTKQPTRSLEINSTNGNVLKLSSNSGTDNSISTEFNILPNGQLNISSNTFNILSNYTTNGLKLNNILVRTPPSTLNKLKNIISGTSQPLFPLITDSNNNISNINSLRCNSLTVNGSNINTSSNNIYFTDSQIGQALSTKALITDDLNNISNINSLSVNNFKVNSNLITNKINNNNITHNLNIYDKLINKPNIETFFRTFNNFRTLTLTSTAVYTSVIWVTELQMFISVMSTNSTNTNRIMTSYNGITWTENTNSILASNTFQSLCWSPDLKLLIAFNNNLSNQRLFTSSDGFNWYPEYDNILNYNFVSVCWSPELYLFVAVSADSNNGRIITSQSGRNWSLVKTINIDFIQVIWANKLNLFVAINNSVSTGTGMLISTDGINWTDTIISISNRNIALQSICWSEELNMLYVITNSNAAYYSYDGFNWLQLLLPFNNIRNIYWINDLNLFIITPNAGQLLSYSNDGFNWYRTTSTFAQRIDSIAWSSDLKKILMLPFNSSTGYLSNTILPTNSLNTVVSQSNNLIINKTNGNFGIGLNPSYQLELSTDSAAKASSSTWTVGSDIRLKEDIENANLDLCYNNFKNIDLVRYTWKTNIYNDTEISDRSQLGWIAQDIETIFPKSVITINKFNISDCKQLNSDQLFSTLYGTVQKLISNFENQETEINNIQTELTNIETFLNN